MSSAVQDSLWVLPPFSVADRPSIDVTVAVVSLSKLMEMSETLAEVDSQ